MTAFDLTESVVRAGRRLGVSEGKLDGKPGGRSGGKAVARSDAGKPRIAPGALDCVAAVLGGQERPGMGDVMKKIAAMCRARRLAPPSRATIYKLMAVVRRPAYRFDELPAAARAALYNSGPGCDVPGHQVAFYCFNYGGTEAMSFAAGLPWLAIYQAMRLPGWRAKSRGLIEAVAFARGIADGRA